MDGTLTGAYLLHTCWRDCVAIWWSCSCEQTIFL